MFNPLTWLDSILLGVAQKFCDKFHRVTGLTKFTLQKWSLIFGTSLLTWLTLSRMEGFVSTSFLIIVTVISTRIDEESKRRFLKKGKIRYESLYERRVRIPTVILSTFALLLIYIGSENILLSVCLCISFISWIYFVACIPRPPSKSKAREWCDKMLKVLNDSLKPAPAFVPIRIPGR
ncbi:MAG: hypothetical protein Q8P17_00540 [bacterium]|nr:hypothetical protein [bacterium]